VSAKIENEGLQMPLASACACSGAKAKHHRRRLDDEGNAVFNQSTDLSTYLREIAVRTSQATAGLRVIPLCHSGQLVDDLPPPLGLFMGIGLDQSDAAERLLVGIADGLGLGHPGKRLNFEAMLKDMRTAALRVKASRAVQVAPREDREGNDLEPEQVRILQALASAKNQGADIQLADLPSVAKIKPAAFTHYIDHLHKWQFIYIDRYTTGDDEVRLLPKGSKWLLDRNAMPD
jgi:plasmid stability protein